MTNPFDTGNGPNYWAVFQKGRLNPNIPEHADIIKKFMRAMEGSEQYNAIIDQYQEIWKVQIAERTKKEETEPKSQAKFGETPLKEAMVATSDPSTRVVVQGEVAPVTVKERVKKAATRKAKSPSKKHHVNL